MSFGKLLRRDRHAFVNVRRPKQQGGSRIVFKYETLAVMKNRYAQSLSTPEKK
jgi:hypothetical protein